MADQKPDLEEGYLGPQKPSFDEMGIETVTHQNWEIVVKDNRLEIKFKTSPGRPLKFAHKLVLCKDKTEHNQLVFTHTRDKVAAFFIQLPEKGYYKFELFALPCRDDSKSLPNVINYLIYCKSALDTVYPFPKLYAQWKDGCYLCEPMYLHKDVKLTGIQWKVHVPNAKAVAVVADGQWFHLDKKGDDLFESKFDLHKYRSKGAKVTLNANFGDDDTKYSTLLEYNI